VKEAFDGDELADLGFSPAVPEGTDTDTTSASPRVPNRTPRRLRRRLAGGLVLLAALVGMGGAYAVFASSSGAADTAAQGNITEGKSIYQQSCIACHGANLEGVPNKGVTLIGSGSAAAYFQLSTGRMPLAAQGAEAVRKPVQFTEEEIDAIAAYVQSVGGGPEAPTGNLRELTNLTLADGGQLFLLNCASCHGSTGGGAPLSAGKSAPGLHEATDKQIYTAMQSGPEAMPVFSDNQLTPEEKRAIVAYIQNQKESKNPGGAGLARIGPVSEGLVIWVVGIGAVVMAIVWIGAKS
jgi:ubiquinol-cytochrome c reductase cytochrome c subunit